MFKRLRDLINKIIYLQNLKETKKYYAVHNEWVRFYEKREKHLGGVHTPAFILANQQMKIIYETGQLNFYYKKIQQYKKQIPVEI